MQERGLLRMLELSESKSEGGKLSMLAWLLQSCHFPALPFCSWLVLGCSGRANSPWKGVFFLSRAGGYGLSWLSAFPSWLYTSLPVPTGCVPTGLTPESL